MSAHDDVRDALIADVLNRVTYSINEDLTSKPANALAVRVRGDAASTYMTDENFIRLAFERFKCRDELRELENAFVKLVNEGFEAYLSSSEFRDSLKLVLAPETGAR